MPSTERTSSSFSRLHHISLVVADLDASTARLERLGFGPFVDCPPLAEYVELDVALLGGDEGDPPST